MKPEIKALLSEKKWFKQSSPEVQQAVLNSPESFSAFVEELAKREEKINNIEVTRLLAISFGNHFVLPVFEVKNVVNGKLFEYEFIGRKRGEKHSVRGLIMIEKEGELKYFLVRRSWRFAVGREVNESIGSIYEPNDESRQDKFKFKNYLEGAFSQQMGVKNLRFERFYDLGWIYPDMGMSHHKVSLFAAVLDGNKVDWTKVIKTNKMEQKNYEFSYELVPTDKLLEYLRETNDAHLLAIFGRLQALNVVKL
jgi:hypothetical protein